MPFPENIAFRKREIFVIVSAEDGPFLWGNSTLYRTRVPSNLANKQHVHYIFMIITLYML